MLSPSTLLLAFAATAIAQSATSPTVSLPTTLTPAGTNTAAVPAGTGTSSSANNLGALVAQFPQCAMSCLNTASRSIGCQGPADFGCLCTNSDKLIQSVGPCVFFSGCSEAEKTKVTTLAPQICVAFSANQQNPAALASGTSAVSSIVNAAGITTGTSGNAALPARTGAPLAAVVGAAGAWMMIAL